jgi:hypothetical protein
MEGSTVLFRMLDDKMLLFVLVFALVALNAVLHAFKEWFTDRYKRRSDDNAIIDRELRPLLGATTDLVSRLLELLLQTGSRLQQQHQWQPLTETDKPDVLSLNRAQTTALRFIAFLATRQRFRLRTSRISSRRLERIRFYLDRKLPTALKGNIFAAEILGNEAAEVLGEYFQPEHSSDDITALCLLRKVGSNEGRALFNTVLQRLAINLEKLREFIESDAPVIDSGANRILALSHLAIILLDFQQDVSQTPHWEETRIVLCKMLAKYNKAREKAAFLYSQGDLSGTSYVLSYSSYATSERPRGRSWWSQRRTTRALARRGRLRRESHPVKDVSHYGVKASMGTATVELLWSDDVSTLVRKLNTFLLSTRKLVSVAPNISVKS